VRLAHSPHEVCLRTPGTQFSTSFRTMIRERYEPVPPAARRNLSAILWSWKPTCGTGTEARKAVAWSKKTSPPSAASIFS
jgi:hypothetical protein